MEMGLEFTIKLNGFSNKSVLRVKCVMCARR